MGCTWISVASLAVLIFASFMANMKASSQTPPTVTKQEQTTAAKHPIPIVPTTDQLSTDKAVTSVPVVTQKTYGQLENITTQSNKINSSEIYNCTVSANVTAGINCSETLTTSKYPVRTVVTYRDFPEYNRYKHVILITPYITNIPGFFTNSFTIIIALHIKPLHTSELYMIVLGCADLLTVIGRFTLRVVENSLESRTAVDCKITWYIVTVSQVYSNLILVSWTIERFIAVMFPMKLAAWCSKRNTKITSAFLLVFCIGFTVPYITEIDTLHIWNGREMVNVCHFTKGMFTIWIHIESAYYIYIPIICVFVCNLAILCRLSSMAKARINMASNQETIDKKVQENRKMTILLLTISGSFLILHIPYAINMVLNYIYPDVTDLILKDPHAFAKFIFYTSLGYCVTEFQNSTNFFLYCISGTKFRTTFRKIFCKHLAIKKTETTQISATRSTNF